MTQSSFAGRWNLDLLDENYRRWKQDPASVDPDWRTFFEGFELGLGRPAQAASDSAEHGECALHMGIVTATEIRAEFLKAERIVELVAVDAENPRRGSCVWR